MELPRGYRDNNPGNIDKSDSVHWVGETDNQPNGSDLDPRFVTFDNPADGIAAIMKILRTYQEKHNLKSVQQLISRWAPPNENPTQSYVAFVTKRLGVKATDPVDITSHDVAITFAKAIVETELGPASHYVDGDTTYPEAWYPDDIYEAAFHDYMPEAQSPQPELDV